MHHENAVINNIVDVGTIHEQHEQEDEKSNTHLELESNAEQSGRWRLVILHGCALDNHAKRMDVLQAETNNVFH